MDTAAGPFLGMHQTAPDVEYPRENAPLESLAPNNARLSPVCSLQQRFLDAGMEPPPRPSLASTIGLGVDALPGPRPPESANRELEEPTNSGTSGHSTYSSPVYSFNQRLLDSGLEPLPRPSLTSGIGLETDGSGRPIIRNHVEGGEFSNPATEGNGPSEMFGSQSTHSS